MYSDEKQLICKIAKYVIWRKIKSNPKCLCTKYCRHSYIKFHYWWPLHIRRRHTTHCEIDADIFSISFIYMYIYI